MCLILASVFVLLSIYKHGNEFSILIVIWNKLNNSSYMYSSMPIHQYDLLGFLVNNNYLFGVEPLL